MIPPPPPHVHLNTEGMWDLQIGHTAGGRGTGRLPDGLLQGELPD